MIEFLRQEYLDAGGALVRTLRNGKRRVTKKDVKQRHPFIKDGLADFVRAHPNVLDTYKCGYPSRSTCLAPLDASQAYRLAPAARCRTTGSARVRGNGQHLLPIAVQSKGVEA
jgi:hypothetical protein